MVNNNSSIENIELLIYKIWNLSYVICILSFQVSMKFPFGSSEIK
jgi:hypothetical protein